MSDDRLESDLVMAMYGQSSCMQHGVVNSELGG